MRLLLDTSAFLFWVDASPRLSKPARRAIEDPSNTCFVSHASAWELAIKVSIGKLKLTKPVGSFFSEHLSANAFDAIAIELDHVAAVETMPRHHGDPFDRLLVAQALAETLVIVSPDKVFAKYGVSRLW